MSPAYSTNESDVFSWVGVIMYLPAACGAEERDLIRKEFVKYGKVMQPLLHKYGARIHWAKIELPNRNDLSPIEYEIELDAMRKDLANKYPISDFNDLMRALDPNQILTNSMVEELICDTCPLPK